MKQVSPTMQPHDRQLWVSAESSSYRWWSRSDYWRTPGECGDLNALLAALGQAEPVLIVPAERVVLRQLTVDAAERRVLRQTLPYQLEDELVSDVDTLHFAWSEPEAGQVATAIVDRDWLASVSAPLRAVEREWAAIWPEPLLLPLPNDGWRIHLSARRWVLRHGPYLGFGLEPDLAVVMLAGLIAETPTPPVQLQWQGEEEQYEALITCLPEAWREHLVKVTDTTASEPDLDLAQGDFARRIPWRRWWQTWRVAAALLGVAVGLQFALTGLDYRRQAADNLVLRQAIEASFREAMPRGAMVEPERQLQRRLDALRGSGDAGFVALLEPVGRLLAERPSVSLDSLNYVQAQRELRLTINAERFADVEALRQALNQAGLSAELAGSNSDGQQTKARLRIRGGDSA